MTLLYPDPVPIAPPHATLLPVNRFFLLLEQRHYRSPLSPEQLREAARAVVEPAPWPPSLTFKMSGAGVVTRVIAAPTTARPFFGQVDAPHGMMRLALATQGRDASPFQPLLFCSLSPLPDGGAALHITLRPHREALSLRGVYALLGGGLALTALPAILQGNPVAVAAVLAGAVAIVFPTLRAQLSFQADRDRALAALEDHLPLSPTDPPQAP